MKVIETWIKELESDKYPKGRGALARVSETQTTYCCLGVLCEMLKDKAKLETVIEDERGVVYQKYNNCACFVPKEVDNILNFPAGSQSRLANLNDSVSTFAPVVKLIKELVEEGTLTEVEIE